MATVQTIKILLIEDSPSDAHLVQAILAESEQLHFEVTWVDRLEAGLEKLRDFSFRVVLTDLGLPDSVGKNTYLRIMAAAPKLAIIVLTGLADESLGSEAIQNGVQDYLVKGTVDGKTIARTIRYAIERKQAKELQRAFTRKLSLRARELEEANKSLTESRQAALNLIVETNSALTEITKQEKQLHQYNRTLMAHTKSSQAMMRMQNEKIYLNEVCNIVTEVCGHAMVWIGFSENDDRKTVLPVASAGFDEGYLDQLDISWADSPQGSGPTGMAIRTGKPQGCKNMLTDPDFVLWREQALQRGYASSLALPLSWENTPFGAVTIYSKQPDSFSCDEVELLSDLANDLAYGIVTIRMQQERLLAEETVRKERNFTSAIIQTTGGLIIGLDPEGRVQLFNKTCEKLTGYTFEELKGKPFWDYLLLPEEMDVVRGVFQGIKEGKFTAESEFENYWVTKNKSLRFIKWANSTLSDAQGNVELILATGIDITEEKENRGRIDELNSFLMKKTTDLLLANKELESFSYSVSHDLRGPLRGIKGFCEILLEDYLDKLDTQGRDFLTRIKNSTDKMSDLIDDMLNLAQISRQEMTLKPIDLSALAHSIVEELRLGEPQRTVDVGIAQDLRAFGDSRLMHIALSNLLGNAWKYSSKIPNAKIEFQTIESNGERVYFVRDNGAGFNMAYASKLFVPFQRLHSDSQFPGTGIGLAIVNRIIQRHGGRIWGESEIGKGATFNFTLAIAKKE